jgi:ribonuclease HI
VITYYTDGSASPNPGPGGFSVIKEMAVAVLGGEPDGTLVTTNIRMEGLAIIAALKDSKGESCVIYTDSEFWINVITIWSHNWEKNGWTKKGGIKNLDIVQEACTIYKASDAKLIWTKGHAGDPGNELADVWANKAREQNILKAKS